MKQVNEILALDETLKLAKPVPGFPNYVAYSDGRIFNKKKGLFVKERELPPGSGYKAVVISADGKAAQIYVAKLIGQMFVKNPNPTLYTKIRHKDRNKSNNNANNLVWCTHQEACKEGKTGENNPVKKAKQRASARQTVRA